MTSVQVQISKLCTVLREETAVTKRRDAAQKLRNLVTDNHAQQRLLQEASGKEALVALWRSIIGSALFASERTVAKGKGIKEEDVLFPNRLLISCTHFASFAQIESLLPSKEVRELLTYCLAMLSNDKVLELAEKQLLDMLDHLCSRPEYVAFFRPGTEMDNILAETEVRIGDPSDESKYPAVYEAAAKAFCSLLKSSKTVGIGVHTLIPNCLTLVNGWCRSKLADESWSPGGSKILPYMLRAATSLMTAHPEHCIVAVARQGRSILKLAKLSYKRTQGPQKDAIIEYLLAHILVCQTAGRLEGLLNGDLGDVGPASLNSKHIKELLELVATDDEISGLGGYAQDHVDHMRREPRSVKVAKSTRRARLAAVQPVGERSRLHFELCARLLSCAQRVYLTDAEWDVLEDPKADYLKDVPVYPDPEDPFLHPPPEAPASCAPSELLESPWMLRVALPLLRCSGGLAPRDAHSEQILGTQDTAGSSTSNGVTSQSDYAPLAPILRLMSENEGAIPKSAVPFLQLICACAELFPLGECWTSNTQHCWHRYTPKHHLSEDSVDCNGCTLDDIALVVFLVTNMLEASGGPNGDQDTQIWALICLIRMTESSALVTFASAKKGESSPTINLVWQRVWNTLFNTDLRYASCTRRALSDSVGELVLVLLSEMVRQRCTDPLTDIERGISSKQRSTGGFVHSNQDQVWNLDVFSKAEDIQIQAVFDLTSAMLRFAGLSEGNEDTIDRSVVFHEVADGAGRRFRLAALCLRYIEKQIGTVSSTKRDVVRSACACLLSLISGRATPFSTTFENDVSIMSKRREVRRFSVTKTFEVQQSSSDTLEPTLSSVFQCLWNDEIIPIPVSWLSDSSLSAEEFHRSGVTIARELVGDQQQLLDKYHSDFVSPSTALPLKEFVLEQISAMTQVDEDMETESSSAIGQASPRSVQDKMIYRVSSLKLVMTVSVVFGTDDVLLCQEDMHKVSHLLSEVIDELVEDLPSVDLQTESSTIILTDVLQVLRAFMAVSLSAGSARMPDAVASKLASLYGECSKMLQSYTKTREIKAASSTSVGDKREAEQNSLDFDDDEDGHSAKRRHSGFMSDSSDEETDCKIGDKRRRSSNSWNQRSKRRKESSGGSGDNLPSFACAIRLSAIVVLLQPSYGVCEQVAEVVGFALNEEEGGNSHNRQGSCGLDGRACLHCLGLFCSDMVIHRKHDFPTIEGDEDDVRGSIVSLCCSLVLEMRAYVGLGSSNCLFGFEVCAALVRHRESPGATPLSSEESDDIIEVLLSNSQGERKVLRARPMLRARQLEVGNNVLRLSQENMHNSFDDVFKSELVMPSLSNLYESVRKQLAYSVGESLRLFPQQENIVNRIKTTWPPLLPMDEEKGILPDYHAWCEDKSVGLSNESSAVDAQVWEGALFLLQASVAKAMGVVAGSTTNNGIFRKSLFEMIWLASERPDLEALCLRACEKAAELSSFGTAHKLLLSESEFLIEMWLDKGKSLVELPLLLTAPTVLRRALKAGTARHLVEPGAIALSKKPGVSHSAARHSAMAELREYCARDYVESSVHFIIPITYTKMASTDKDFGGYLKETAQIVVENYDKKSQSKMVRKRLHDILAFAEPLLHDSDEKFRGYGEKIVSLTKKLVETEVYNRTRQKSSRLALHRLLYRWGDQGHSFGEHKLSREAVVEAIWTLAFGDQSDRTSQDPFSAVGSSITECLLFGRFWLSQSVLVRQKERRWSAIELVCSFSVEQIRSSRLSHSQIGYCVHTIVYTLSDPRMQPIYPKVLETLNDLLRNIENSNLSNGIEDEISGYLYRLVGTLMIVHGKSQRVLIDECLSSWEKEHEFSRRCRGLWLSAKHSNHETDDVWGWDADTVKGKEERIQVALGERGSSMNDCVYNILVQSYDALDRVLSVCAGFQGDLALPEQSIRTFVSTKNDFKPLANRNPKLCAQTLAADFLKKFDRSENGHASVEDSVSNFLLASRRMDSTLSSGLGHKQRQAHALEIDSRLFLDELLHLQDILSRSGGSPMVFSSRDINQQNEYDLVRTLLAMSEMESYPSEIRSAAGRCLGAVGPCDIDRLASNELEGLGSYPTSDDDSVSIDGGHRQRIMCSSLEMFSKYLLSPRTETAIAALSSSKAVLSTPEGIQCWSNVKDKDCKRLLGPLVPQSRASAVKPKDFVLNPFYVDSLKPRAASEGAGWCWHEGLWKFVGDGELSYEDWIKKVTCAMITCCYGEVDETESTTEQVRGSAMFFRYCINLCALEPEFAAQAFPGVVLDLLLSGSSDSSEDQSVLRKLNDGRLCSTAHEQLSRCFELLVNSAARDGNAGPRPMQSSSIKAVSLAVDTIDMLRTITQKQFLGSKSHKRNARTADEHDSVSLRRKSATKEEIPYGVVLRLSGLQVASACIHAKRYASALFYADMMSEWSDRGNRGTVECMSNGHSNESDAQVNDGMLVASVDSENRLITTAQKNRASIDSVLKQSFLALDDQDDAAAIEVEEAATSFLDDGFKWNPVSSIQGDALGHVKTLDSQCQRGDSSAGYTRIEIANCMEDIGLEGVLHTYINGMLANQDCASSTGLSPVDQSALRDRWFRGCMKAMQWSGKFYDETFAQEPPASKLHSGRTSLNNCGFHEGLAKALSSFLKDDRVAFRGLLGQARSVLMDDLCKNVGGEAPLRGTVDIVGKMQLLNELDGLTHEESCYDLATRWGEQNTDALEGSVVDFPRMVPEKMLHLDDSIVSIREIMLRAFQAKNSSSSRFSDCLISHFWQTSAVARRVGNYDFADSCVQRLHGALLTKQTEGLENATLLRVRFEEAMIMESRGDFSGAIRGLKLLSNHLKDLRSGNGGLSPVHEALYADSLITCGEWMGRYKVELGKGIMEHYLKPASEIARHISRQNPSHHAAHRSAVAYLSLAHLVYGLYDSARKRLDSPEWEKAGDFMASMEKDLTRLKELSEEANKASRRGKKRKSSSTDDADPAVAKKVAEQRQVSISAKSQELHNMKEERNKTEASVPKLLRLALESYGNALSCAGSGESSVSSKHVYQFVSLWLENDSQGDYATTVNEIINEVIHQIQTYRFVPLAYQLFSRIGKSESKKSEAFQRVLKKLIYRTSLDHPYHCIVQLLALSNGKKVGDERGAVEYLQNLNVAKVESAEAILSELQKSESKYVPGLIDAYRALFESYIGLALACTKRYHDKNQFTNISLSAVTRGRARLDRCLGTRNSPTFTYMPCVVTKPPAIRPGGDYGDGIDNPVGSELIASFDPNFSISESGLSRPKIVHCVGINGGRFKQIVKGNDDVRGDAVMQQVFCYVNKLMKRTDESLDVGDSRLSNASLGHACTPRALKDQLKLVTYSIVPLSPRAGVLEWVADTIPFGDYLTDSPKKKRVGAHSRYYPGEWGPDSLCREKYKKAKAGEKRKVYNDICENCTPSFRFFFAERFGHSLPAWYAARMKYTRSCAVNSMVGHVLGIGDRHAQNILIRETTGEVAHIDFGIVFEQGKSLQTPETVPFRLTRDIVDGMGPCGTEGTFSRACEATISVLRENSNGLLTILSAVVSDPLFKWSLTPREAQKRQRNNDDDDEEEEEEDAEENQEAARPAEVQRTAEQENEAGERAIAKIREKLEGYEDGTSGEKQSVQGQVQFLINSARDPDNLCRIFHGWSPWL